MQLTATEARLDQEELGVVIKVRRDRIRRCEDQPRTWFDPDRLKELADSIAAVGQKIPVIVRKVKGDPEHDYELVDGERRWLACEMKGIKYMIACVTDKTDPEEIFEDSVTVNNGREGHTTLEKAHAMQRLRKRRSVEEIAKIFTCSTALVYQHMNLLKLPPQVLQLMEPSTPEERRIVFSVAVLFFRIPIPDEQIELALEISEKGLSVNQAKHLIEMRAAKLGFSVKHPERRPSDDYNIFAQFWHRTCDQLHIFNEAGVDRYKKLFQFRKAGDHMALMTVVEECQKITAEILGKLRRI